MDLKRFIIFLKKLTHVKIFIDFEEKLFIFKKTSISKKGVYLFEKVHEFHKKVHQF